MKRETFAITLIIVMLFGAMASLQPEFLVKGNVMIGIVPPVINVVSPTNTTYNTNNISVNARFTTITTGLYDGGPRSENTRLFTYSLDGKNPENFPITNFSIGLNPGTKVSFEGEVNLRDLTEGLHNLTIRVVFNYSKEHYPSETSHYYSEAESVVFFRVDTVSQNISILKPDNKTYLFDVPLELFIDEPAMWIGYSLDGKENVAVTGNTTLGGLLVGEHTLTLYANDTAGNPAVSKTVTFQIADIFPMLLVIGVSIFVVGILVYFRKHKREDK